MVLRVPFNSTIIFVQSLFGFSYLTLFITQGYDVPSVARLTSEDLIALGITDPTDRKMLHINIQDWGIGDNWPTNVDRNASAA